MNELTGKIDVKHFLLCLGIEFEKPKGKEVNFHCPFPGHTNNDQTPSAYMNINTTAFFCHGCHKGGNAITFAADMLGISRMKSIQYLREKYDPGYFESGRTSTSDELRRILTSKQQPQEERQPLVPDDALEGFNINWEFASEDFAKYMLDRGFGADTLEAWNIGYDPHSERITIPVRDERNNLIGFKGRAYYDKDPKYLVLGDREGKPQVYGWPTYATGRVVFGLPNAIMTEDPLLEDASRHFVVCEGELNAIAVWQAGYAGIAINGSNLTEYQIETIRREADRLTLYFDDDTAGHRATRSSVQAFVDHMPVHIVLSDKDAADSTQEEIANNIEHADGVVQHVLKS